MESSVPTTPDQAVNLADILPSCLSAMGVADPVWLDAHALTARIPLPSVRAAVVVLVDGLGANALAARSGHARFLSASRRRIRSGFPTTTGVALPTLTTGRPPGAHGVVGYSAWNPDTRTVMNMLSGWDNEVPADWLLVPTLFTVGAELGVHATTIGPSHYRNSGMTASVLGGATYRSADSIAERVDETLAVVAAGGRSLVYLYVPELDSIGHKAGWASDKWIGALEELDVQLARLHERVGSDVGIVVTADHGVIDVPAAANVAMPEDLLADVVGVAGDPRCHQLILAPGVELGEATAAWQASLGKRAWVADRDTAIGAGWFGTVEENVRARIGDIVIVARGQWAFNDDRGQVPGSVSRRMIGQHGAMTDDELFVPLRLAGGFGG